MDVKKPSWHKALYAITPDMDDVQTLTSLAIASVQEGVDAIQLRSKTLNVTQRKQVALALIKHCAQCAHNPLFVMNDDIALALSLNAPGIHIGRDDLGLDELPALRAQYAGVIGVSCYNDLTRAQRAVQAGADYVAFGSLFASCTKPQAHRASLGLLMQARALPLGVPIVGIGGIDANNIASVYAAGADAAAVCGALFGDIDVKRQT